MQTPRQFQPSATTNMNLLSLGFQEAYAAVLGSREALLTRVVHPALAVDTTIRHDDHETSHAEIRDGDKKNSSEHPHAMYIQPVYASIHDPAPDSNDDPQLNPIVGMLTAVLPWDRFLVDLLPSGTAGITCVLTNNCNQSFTYRLEGPSVRTADVSAIDLSQNNLAHSLLSIQATYIGPGDLHDLQYEHTRKSIPFFDHRPNIADHCEYSFELYATSDLASQHHTASPAIVGLVVGASFLILGISFFSYDRFARKRHDKVVQKATQSTAFVSSLFPATVRDRVMASQNQPPHGSHSHGRGRLAQKPRDSADNTESSQVNDGDVVLYKSKPIADLFPETTVLFADIAGFTAWSSTREPAQVFVLLETIYNAFDTVAHRLGVYKVETVGDCYVAVTGVPNPRADHTLVMATFALQCLGKFSVLVRKLDARLGPGTDQLGKLVLKLSPENQNHGH
jgi:Adenylate and Guanylate cyclase catalytic domain